MFVQPRQPLAAAVERMTQERSDPIWGRSSPVLACAVACRYPFKRHAGVGPTASSIRGRSASKAIVG
jgi:hypothetical protein